MNGGSIGFCDDRVWLDFWFFCGVCVGCCYDVCWFLLVDVNVIVVVGVYCVCFVGVVGFSDDGCCISVVIMDVEIGLMFIVFKFLLQLGQFQCC